MFVFFCTSRTLPSPCSPRVSWQPYTVCTRVRVLRPLSLTTLPFLPPALQTSVLEGEAGSLNPAASAFNFTAAAPSFVPKASASSFVPNLKKAASASNFAAAAPAFYPQQRAPQHAGRDWWIVLATSGDAI